MTTRTPPLWLLILLVSMGNINGTLYTPALPNIAETFDVSISMAQLTMTLYLVGYALGQLPYGPLSNRYGRKPALYAGLGLGIFGSLLCVISAQLHSFALLASARFLMALGASSGLMISFTIVIDHFPLRQARQKLATVQMAFALVPALGIALGGFLVTQFGWRSCFYFLSGYSLLIGILTHYLMPETHRKEHIKLLSLLGILSDYAAQLRDQRLVFCGLLMGASTACIYIFISQSPFIAMDQLGLQPDEFGVLNLIPPIGLLSGTILANFCAKRFSSLQTICIGLALFMIGFCLLFHYLLSDTITAWALFLPISISYIGIPLVFSNASALGTIYATDKSNASAVIQFLNMTVTVIGVVIIQLLPSQNNLTLPGVFAIMIGIMLISFTQLVKTSPWKMTANED